MIVVHMYSCPKLMFDIFGKTFGKKGGAVKDMRTLSNNFIIEDGDDHLQLLSTKCHCIGPVIPKCVLIAK